MSTNPETPCIKAGLWTRSSERKAEEGSGSGGAICIICEFESMAIIIRSKFRLSPSMFKLPEGIEFEKYAPLSHFGQKMRFHHQTNLH